MKRRQTYISRDWKFLTKRCVCAFLNKVTLVFINLDVDKQFVQGRGGSIRAV